MMQWAENTIEDLRFALRGWRRTPGFAIAAIATLALGIGANTAIFSIVSGVLLRPLPFDHPERLVQLNSVDPRFGIGAVYFRDLDEWRQQGTALDEIVGYANTARNLLDSGEPERLQA